MSEPKDYNIDEILYNLELGFVQLVQGRLENGMLKEPAINKPEAKAQLYELITKEIIGENEAVPANEPESLEEDLYMIEITTRNELRLIQGD